MAKENKKINILIISILTLIVLVTVTITSNAILKKIQRDKLEVTVDKSKLEKKTNTNLEIEEKINEKIDENSRKNIKMIALKIAGQIEKDFEKAKEISIEQIHNKKEEINYYKIITEKFEIELNEDLSLRSYNNRLSEKRIPEKMEREEGKKMAEEFIKNLKLDNEYKLTYLEPFMNNSWEAGYSLKSQELEDPNNMIKIFFGKSNGIDVLRVHKTNIKIMKEKISKEEAIKIVKNQFKDIEKIENIKKVMVKPNNFFTKKENEEFKEKKESIKAWEVTAIKKIKNWDKKYLIYVNIETGEIIAGHSMK